MPEFIPRPATGLKWRPFTKPGATPSPSLIQRLFRIPRPDLAREELERVLATKAPHETSPGVISDTLRAYHVKGRDAHDILVQLYKQALERSLVDHALSDKEQSYLSALRKLFDLGEDDIIAVEAELIHPRFQRAVAEVIADEKVTADEREALAKIGAGLRVSSQMQQEIFRESASELLKKVLDRALADHRLAPEEQETLERVAAQLGITLEQDAVTQQALARFALLWRIENGELPAFPTKLLLQEGEVCHFMTPATLHELAKMTGARVARGVYYRATSSPAPHVAEADLRQVESGTLYVTDRRILFHGERKDVDIKLANVLSFQVFTGGIALEKSRGKSRYVQFDGDVELLAAILGRLLARN